MRLVSTTGAQQTTPVPRERSPEARVSIALAIERIGTMHAHEMISTHPHVQGNTNAALIQCIIECYDCSQVCTSCSDACLGEQTVQHLTQCIRLNMDCAEICVATGSVATRRTGS